MDQDLEEYKKSVEKLGLSDLEDIYNHINRDKYPERFKFVSRKLGKYAENQEFHGKPEDPNGPTPMAKRVVCPNCEETMTIPTTQAWDGSFHCPKCAFVFSGADISGDRSFRIANQTLNAVTKSGASLGSYIRKLVIRGFAGFLILVLANFVFQLLHLNYVLSSPDYGKPEQCFQVQEILQKKIEQFNQIHDAKISRFDKATISCLEREKFFDGIPDHVIYPAQPLSLDFNFLFDKWLQGRIKGGDGRHANYENFRGENLDRGGRIECVYHTR